MAIGGIGKTLRHIQVAFDVRTLTGLTDRQLVERFASGVDDGAELAFAALVQKHGPMVLRVCRSVLRNHQDAQDAFQATFLILARKAGSLWVRDSVGPWLHGVACRVATCSKSAAVRRRIHEHKAAELTASRSEPRDDDHDDLKALLHEQLARLPAKYRVPIVLCDLEGQTYEGVARQLGLPVGTVKSRLARGRERLRRRMVRHGACPSLGVFAQTLPTETTQTSVSSALIDATAQLAARLHGGPAAIKLVPAAIVGLMEGVLKMMFLSKLKVAAASVAIGCGLFSVSMLSLGPGLRADGPLTVQGRGEGTAKEPSFDPQSISRSTPPPDEPGMLPPPPPPPKPWETVVKMRILGKNNVRFGSGTIVHSTPDESIVLTAAHHFKVGPEGKPVSGFEPTPLDTGKGSGIASSLAELNFLEQYRKDLNEPDRVLKELVASSRTDQPLLSKFPFKITIELFDGKLTGSKPARVHFLEAVAGELVDQDFKRDVALVRIRPGRRLAASPVVPPRWAPKTGMQVLTVGCSEGRDATAWHTTITNPMVRSFLSGNPAYEAIECQTAPKQGRSGGGLFTSDGYVAGVCNYAEPQHDQGHYATPGSIYRILDRNGLTSVHKSDGRYLDDRIGSLAARIEEDAAELRRLKELRRRAAEKPVEDSSPSPERAIDSDVGPTPSVEPARRAPESAELDHRLREVEKTLERVLERLDTQERDHKVPR